MKKICQIYLPSFHRSYGEKTFGVVTKLLPTLKKAGFVGIYLIALWRDGGFDNGFDVVEYSPNPKFGITYRTSTFWPKTALMAWLDMRTVCTA